MRSFWVICVFSIGIVYVYGAVSIIPADKTSDHPGYCKSATTGSMEIGETKSIDGCIRATCNDDGSISLASCGTINSPCGLTNIDPSKPYPDCCPQPQYCQS